MHPALNDELELTRELTVVAYFTVLRQPRFERHIPNAVYLLVGRTLEAQRDNVASRASRYVCASVGTVPIPARYEMHICVPRARTGRVRTAVQPTYRPLSLSRDPFHNATSVSDCTASHEAKGMND
jgi:hypothetical protein